MCVPTQRAAKEAGRVVVLSCDPQRVPPLSRSLFVVSECQYRLSTFNSPAHSACLSISFVSIKASHPPRQSPSPLSDFFFAAERVHPGPCLRGVGLQCRDFPLAESQHGRGNAIRAELRASQGTHGPDHGPVTR